LKVRAEQFDQPVAVAVLDDPEDRCPGGRGGPHRAILAGQKPAGLIDVDRPAASTDCTDARAGRRAAAGAAGRSVDRVDRDPDWRTAPGAARLMSAREIRLRPSNATYRGPNSRPNADSPTIPSVALVPLVASGPATD